MAIRSTKKMIAIQVRESRKAFPILLPKGVERRTMRIIYDDSKQRDFLDVCDKFIEKLRALSEQAKELGLVAYSNGRDRVQAQVVRQMLSDFAKGYGFEVGKTVSNAYGIGNNRCYPVYYHAEEQCGELQHCANVNINSGLHDEAYFNCTDYNGERVWGSYTLGLGKFWNPKRKCIEEKFTVVFDD